MVRLSGLAVFFFVVFAVAAGGCAASFPRRGATEFVALNAENAGRLAGVYHTRSDAGQRDFRLLLSQDGQLADLGKGEEGGLMRIVVVSRNEIAVSGEPGNGSRAMRLHGRFEGGYFVLDERVAPAMAPAFLSVGMTTWAMRLGLDGKSNLILDCGQGGVLLFLGIVPVNVTAAKAREAGIFERVTETAERQGVWEWAEGDGDKPGNGLRLVVGKGGEVSGWFYLLDSNLPLDLDKAARSVALREVKMEGRRLRFLIVLSSARGEVRMREELVLEGDLSGAVGSEVMGELRGEDGGRGRVILLVRKR